MAAKYIFVTGGVLSGLGKGILAASIGNTLKRRGYNIFSIKFDPYLNFDAGTLNPGEHGECFVTADGAECDLDLGHYERFLDVELTRDSSVMSGQIYASVLEKERQGKYLGKTVQVIPHVTNEIKSRLYQTARKQQADVLIVEIGGTIGDIEASHFVEAIRQVGWEIGQENVIYVHLGFLPYLATSNELKTKPIQNSLNDLRKLGIEPSLVFCRSDKNVKKEYLRKVALFAGLKEEAVIPMPTLRSIYEVPQLLISQNVDKLIIKRLSLPKRRPRNMHWQQLINRIRRSRERELNIGLVGKYMAMKDTYFSVTEALKAACWFTGYNLNINWIDSEDLEANGLGKLKKISGLIVPGGFGARGTEGIISAIKYAREKKLPFLGLCFGLQLACVEFARNVLNLKGANTTEIDPNTPHPVICLMSEQEEKLKNSAYGATMRLGNYKCLITPDTLARRIYKQSVVTERHRHRYEFNNKYREQFTASGHFQLCGLSPDKKLVEMIELNDHPFFIATQAHPEFRSRPNRPHPLFESFIKNAILYAQFGPVMV